MEATIEGIALNGGSYTKEMLEECPFIQYYFEDKSHYQTATQAGYVDPDNDFLIGNSGGFLMNLDFQFVNTYLLRPAANEYVRLGKYTNLKGRALEEWRITEERRRRYGYVENCKQLPNGDITELRITGSHYNFINYCPIVKLDEESIITSFDGTQTGEKKRDFPNMFEPQYWYFKAKEFAKRNGFHLISCKTRRAGFSYIEATDSAHKQNANPFKVYLHIASDSKYLTKAGGLTDFAFNQLLFYENETPFKRGFISRDKENTILGYKDKEGNNFGFQSALVSLSAMNNPDVAIGKDGAEIKCEELSMFDNFDDFIGVTDPATKTGSVRTGIINAWGTGGSRQSSWQIFESNFYNPLANNFMPFENVWDKNAREQVCGFYKPYMWGLQGDLDGVPAMDKNGNPKLDIAYKISMKERAYKFAHKKSFSDYVIYCGQYSNNPAESFNSISDNIFSSKELDDHIHELQHNDDYKFYVDGMLEEENNIITFRTNEYLKEHGKTYNVDFYDYIENVPRRSHEHPHGCIRRWYTPQKINGVVPAGMYSATYDPVGVNKENKDITLKHSHNSISIWMEPCSYNNYKERLVMKYYGRPETLEGADKIFYLMCRYYGIVNSALVEINRGETISNLKTWGALNVLEKEPVSVWNTTSEYIEGKHLGIVIGDGQKKLDGLRLLKELLYTKVGMKEDGSPIYVLHYIYDAQSLLELKKWSAIGNFDRVSEMILRGIQRKNRDIKGKKVMETRKSVLDEDDPLTRELF